MPDRAGRAFLADLSWTIRQAGCRMDRVHLAIYLFIYLYLFVFIHLLYIVF